MLAIASACRVVPGLYNLRATSDTVEVKLEVRMSNSLGFHGMNDGTVVFDILDSSPSEHKFQTLPGKRYLFVAIPVDAGQEYREQAGFVEFVT